MENKECHKITDAKPVSKWAMIISAVIIITYNIGYLLLVRKIPDTEEQKSILMIGFSILILFSPVYINIFLDKIFGGKK